MKIKINNSVKLFISLEDAQGILRIPSLANCQFEESRKDIYFSSIPTKTAKRIYVKIRNAEKLESPVIYVRVTTYVNSNIKLYALVELMNTNAEARVNYSLYNPLAICCKPKNIIDKINSELLGKFIN